MSLLDPDCTIQRLYFTKKLTKLESSFGKLKFKEVKATVGPRQAARRLDFIEDAFKFRFPDGDFDKFLFEMNKRKIKNSKVYKKWVLELLKTDFAGIVNKTMKRRELDGTEVCICIVFFEPNAIDVDNRLSGCSRSKRPRTCQEGSSI